MDAGVIHARAVYLYNNICDRRYTFFRILLHQVLNTLASLNNICDRRYTFFRILLYQVLNTLSSLNNICDRRYTFFRILLSQVFVSAFVFRCFCIVVVLYSHHSLMKIYCHLRTLCSSSSDELLN